MTRRIATLAIAGLLALGVTAAITVDSAPARTIAGGVMCC
jgi:hypothetical protein